MINKGKLKLSKKAHESIEEQASNAIVNSESSCDETRSDSQRTTDALTSISQSLLCLVVMAWELFE